MRRVLQVTVWVMAMMWLVEGKDDTSSTKRSFSCDLQCANGGYCALVEGTSEELGRQAQSGHLIEKCICPKGFTGIACDVVLDQCNLSNHVCSNGMPCTQNALGEWGCDCSTADALSVFAGYQCRNPVTEYCSGKYEPDAAVAFCTNGGRCVGDFLAAQVAPGDTAFNRAYQQRGCKCPKDFYGPHCEFLMVPEDNTEETLGTLQESNPITTTKKSPHSSFFTAIIVLFCLAIAMTVGSWARYKYKQRSKQVPREIIFDHGSVGSVKMWNGVYKDSNLNGRHHTFEQRQPQNLRIITLFDDDDHEIA